MNFIGRHQRNSASGIPSRRNSTKSSVNFRFSQSQRRGVLLPVVKEGAGRRNGMIATMAFQDVNLLKNDELIAEAYKKQPTLDEMVKRNKKSAFSKLYKQELEQRNFLESMSKNKKGKKGKIMVIKKRVKKKIVVLPKQEFLTKEQLLQRIQENKKLKEEKQRKVQNLKKKNLQQYKTNLKKKIKSRNDKLKENARIEAFNRLNKKCIKTNFTILNLFMFFYQIQRFISFRKNFSETGFHSKPIASIYRWFKERKQVKNKSAAKNLQRLWQIYKTKRRNKSVIIHFISKKLRKSIAIPILYRISKIKTIQRFFRRKIEKKFFEKSLIAVDFNLKYCQIYGLKGASLSSITDKLKVFNQCVNKIWPGLSLDHKHVKSIFEIFEFKWAIM